MLEIVIFSPIMSYFMFQFLKNHRVSRKRQTLAPTMLTAFNTSAKCFVKITFILFKFPLHSPTEGNINLHRLQNHHVVSVFVRISISGG